MTGTFDVLDRFQENQIYVCLALVIQVLWFKQNFSDMDSHTVESRIYKKPICKKLRHSFLLRSLVSIGNLFSNLPYDENENKLFINKRKQENKE